MFRKSALAMAMLGTLTTGNVVALGLGEIDLKSSLNQPLNAEVELLSATDAELEELKVEIGSAAAFAKAGVERPLFLTKLRFDVKTNADGRPVVAITSRETVREPFLDFLLEVSWSKGRLLREYTVLVDPPLTMPAAAPAFEAPATQASRSAAVPVQPARRVSHTAQMPPVSVAPGEYGPTRRNDTLWGIAQQVRPDAGVSIEQTMQSLLRANPEAFVNNNINNLKEGYVLRVPSREDMTSMSRADAVRESRAQYRAWREARGLLAPAGSQGTPQESAAAADAPLESHLQLVAPDTAEGGVAGGAETAELEKLQSDLLMANEALEEQRRQGEDMSARLSVLEEQIVNMQRLIQLKDDELARLQAQAGDAGAEAVAETGLSEALPVAEEPVESVATDTMDVVAEPEAAVGEDVATAEQIGFETVLDEAAVTETPEAAPADAPSAEAPVAEPVEAPAEEEVAVTPEPEPAAEPVAVPATATTPGFVDRLLANPLWLGAGAAVLALLAFVGLRRKRGVETEFQESILQAAQSGAVAESDSEIVTAEPESTQSASSESSLLSEFAVSDMGSIKNDGEADPLAEADVYLAYGRFQQAEDLIKDALQNDAEREDLNLKLLEVYMAGKNEAAFDEHAQSILARLENSADPLWEKIAEMGRELNPGNPLYQEGGAEQAAGDDTAIADLSEDLDFNMDEAPAEPEAFSPADETAEEIESADQGLDFDLDLSFEATEGEKKVDEDQSDSVEFTPPEDLAGEPETLVQEPELDMDSVEPDALEQDKALDFDLEGFDLGTDEETEAEAQGDGELADLDEVSTKLDLARAYIDMGDPDGAKSILDEVMDEGSDNQKEEARDIMAQMS